MEEDRAFLSSIGIPLDNLAGREPPAPEEPVLPTPEDFWAEGGKLLKKEYDRKALGARVMARRCVLGWGQRKLAHTVEMSRGWIRDLEAGIARVPRTGLERLAVALNTTVDYLVKGKASETGSSRS